MLNFGLSNEEYFTFLRDLWLSKRVWGIGSKVFTHKIGQTGPEVDVYSSLLTPYICKARS